MSVNMLFIIVAFYASDAEIVESIKECSFLFVNNKEQYSGVGDLKVNLSLKNKQVLIFENENKIDLRTINDGNVKDSMVITDSSMYPIRIADAYLYYKKLDELKIIIFIKVGASFENGIFEEKYVFYGDFENLSSLKKSKIALSDVYASQSGDGTVEYQSNENGNKSAYSDVVKVAFFKENKDKLLQLIMLKDVQYDNGSKNKISKYTFKNDKIDSKEIKVKDISAEDIIDCRIIYNDSIVRALID